MQRYCNKGAVGTANVAQATLTGAVISRLNLPKTWMRSVCACVRVCVCAPGFLLSLMFWMLGGGVEKGREGWSMHASGANLDERRFGIF